MKKENKILHLLADIINLISTIDQQSKDNPKLSKSILGLAITTESNRILEQLNQIETTLNNDKK